MPKQSARCIDLEQQLAHMRWKRMHAERAIRGSITITKTLQQQDTIIHMSTHNPEEKTTWLNSVVMDELRRPLIVTDEELHTIQVHEAKVKSKLTKFAERQRDNVTKLTKDVEHRAEADEFNREIQIDKLAKLKILQRKIDNQMKLVNNTPDFIHTKQVPPKLFGN